MGVDSDCDSGSDCDCGRETAIGAATSPLGGCRGVRESQAQATSSGQPQRRLLLLICLASFLMAGHRLAITRVLLLQVCLLLWGRPFSGVITTPRNTGAHSPPPASHGQVSIRNYFVQRGTHLDPDLINFLVTV